MKAKQFISDVGAVEAERVAVAAGTNLVYFRQIANGHRNASFSLAQKLVAASQGQLDLMSLLSSTPDRQTA